MCDASVNKIGYDSPWKIFVFALFEELNWGVHHREVAVTNLEKATKCSKYRKFRVSAKLRLKLPKGHALIKLAMIVPGKYLSLHYLKN